ncbi:MAG: cell division protein ZapA [Bacteroidaceae bacterium]
MASDTLSITIHFGTMSIPLNIPREQEYAYRQAEKLIKERYGFYTTKYPGQSESLYMIMTMVDLAVQAMQKELALDITPVMQRLTPLVDELESALSSKQ